MKVICIQQTSTGLHEVVWTHNTDEVGTMLSVAQIMEHQRNDAPWAPNIVGIRIEY